MLVLARLQPVLPVALVALTLPQLVRHWEFGHRTRSWLYGQTPDSPQLAYQRDTMLTPETAKDVRLYQLGDFLQRTMAGLDAIRRRLTVEVSLASMLSAGEAAGVYAFVVWLVRQAAPALATWRCTAAAPPCSRPTC